MDIFNNREIAAGVWFIIFALWFICRSKINIFQTLKPVVKTILVRPIVTSFILLLAYSICLIFILEWIGLWNSEQLKNFVFWFVAVSAVYLSKLRNIESDPDYFSNAAKDALKISAIFQFVLNVYTFNFWIELFLLPIATFFVIIGEFSRQRNEYYKVAKLCENVLAILGIGLIAFTVYKLATDFGEFGKSKTFYDFVVPTTLSIFILPFYYLLGMYCVYERMFARMHFFIKDDSLLSYAKWRSFFAFHFHFYELDRWTHSLSVHEVTTKKDVNKSIKRMLDGLAREEEYARVPFSKGWSPHEASTFLSSDGLKSNPYKEIEPGFWFASTPYLDLGNEILPNNVAYYIEGDECVVKKLILKLNVNETQSSEYAESKFVELADKLCWQSLSVKLPDALKAAISNKISFQDKVRGKELTVTSAPFVRKGYDIRLSIETIQKD